MSDFKPIHRDAIPPALEKAERYRLLNEPAQAESICLDILQVEPTHQRALVMLLLALSDQLQGGSGDSFRQAEEVVARLASEYDRLYYSGILWERRGYALAVRGGPGSAAVACARVHRAMAFYEQAERLRPSDNDDAILRWNSCVRLCQRFHLRPEPGEVFPPGMGED